MRDVAEYLERAGLAWYVTGPEALAAYGAPRQTLDTDVVIDTTIEQLASLAAALEASHYYAEPLRVEKRWMASLVDQRGSGKVDLVVRDRDSWGVAAMERRRRWEHPSWGPTWICSVEDLILAKLEWSVGTSEMQLRDCRMLLRMNAKGVDRDYLDRWSQTIGVGHLLAQSWESDDVAT